MRQTGARLRAVPIPRDPTPDCTLALLREGYEFIRHRAERYSTDAFAARLMLQPTVCMTGAEAASVFYADGRLSRSRALPRSALTLLQDERSVAVLDGRAHRHRKRMFLQLLAPGSFDRLVDLAEAEWRGAAGDGSGATPSSCSRPRRRSSAAPCAPGPASRSASPT